MTLSGKKWPSAQCMPDGRLPWPPLHDNWRLTFLWLASFSSGSDLAKSNVPNVSTFMGPGVGAAEPSVPEVMPVDLPFLFLIRDAERGTILF